jgi:hypothetical protein
MSTSFQDETLVKATRKPHACAYCRSSIPKGSAAIKHATLHDGDFHAGYGHVDCVAMWKAAYNTYAASGDGMPYDIKEALAQDEGRDVIDMELAHWRGRFPHVVTRLEMRMQLSDIRYADSCRALGIEPHPEDFTPIFG